MTFVYEQELKDYMKKKGKHNIIVEMVTSDSSDFEISELHVYLADQKQVYFFRTKKRYRSVETEEGLVLLPPFPLELEEKVVFGLKSFWFLHWVKYQGIRI